MHKRLPPALALPFLALALAACSQEPETVTSESADPNAREVAAAPAVELPPAIKAAKTYRCKDNSLVYVTFLADDVTALVRDKQEEPPVATLKAPAAGEPFAAEGYSLSGSGDTVTYSSPDTASQSCRT